MLGSAYSSSSSSYRLIPLSSNLYDIFIDPCHNLASTSNIPLQSTAVHQTVHQDIIRLDLLFFIGDLWISAFIPSVRPLMPFIIYGF